MSLNLPEDQQTLEQVTAGSASHDVQEAVHTDPQAHPQAEALREGWLLFGQLLEADATPFDEADFLRQLRRRLARRQFARRGLAAALVAGLFVGEAVWQWGGSTPAPAERLSLTGQPDRQKGIQTGSPQAVARSTRRTSTADADIVEGWENLDAEIEVAWLQLETVRQNWRDPLRAIDWLGERLDELEDDLTYGPL